MKKYVFVLLATAVTLSSCFYFDGERIRGNGNVTSEQRVISGFKGVQSYGSFDVYITSDSSYSVKIEADENLMEYVETTINDDNLKISTVKGYSLDPSSTIKVYVSAPIYNAILSSGSGNIYGKNEIRGGDKVDVGISGSGNIDLDLAAGDVSADISGSGSIILDGEANSINSSIAGSGDIKAANLKASKAKIHIAGSGNANVHAAEELDVDIAGSGDVRYSGNARVNSHIAGSGSVSKVD